MGNWMTVDAANATPTTINDQAVEVLNLASTLVDDTGLEHINNVLMRWTAIAGRAVRAAARQLDASQAVIDTAWAEYGEATHYGKTPAEAVAFALNGASRSLAFYMAERRG